MGLLPLEFTDGLTDSPDFRETLQAHERELDLTNTAIKHLIKDIKDLIAAAKNLSRAQRTLSDTLNNFNFECIGSSQTDDEMVIANSFKDFARLLSTIEDERDRLLEKADEAFLEPIERFRREQIGSAKEAKKKFEKETAKYCQNLERFLNLSGKKNETQLAEADALNSLEQQHFFKAMSEYVLKLQEVNERKKFEFVETVLSFMLGWLTFYHQGHEIATDFYSVKMELQMRLQRTRNNFNMTQEETKSLRQKMLNNQEKFKKKFQDFSDQAFSRQGYLFLMEKKAFTTSWTKHFCKFEKNSRKLFLTPFTQTMGKGVLKDDKTYIVVKECIKRSQDTIDRRFCFDIVAGAEDKSSTGTNAHSNSGHFHHHHPHSNVVATNGPSKSSSHSPNIFSSLSSSENTNNVIYTFQALSEEDYKCWLETLEARDPQPVLNNPKIGKLSLKNNDNAKNHSTNDGGSGSSTVHHNIANDSYELDAHGYWFVKKCIQSIESKGLDQKGIYRVVGVTSRVRTLMEMFLQSKSKNVNTNHNAVGNDNDQDNCVGKANNADQNYLNLDETDLLPGFDVDSDEFETKTITSALKSYLRNLVEPIMTFELHNAFISAAKLENRNLRIEKIHQLVHKLPPINFKILKILIQHLQKVAKMQDKNLMTFSNLGVCFGPTLLRTAEESVAAIMDIKFVNVIAELLIENYEKFFLSKPSASMEDTASSHQAFHSQIQQRPLPNVPVPIQQQNPYGTATGMIVRSMVSPQSQTATTEAVPNFNRYMAFNNNNNANNNHGNSGHDQFYTIPLSSSAISLSSRNRSAAYNSANNGMLLQQSTTSTVGPGLMLHPQHSKQPNQQQQYSPLNYSTYHTLQPNQGTTAVGVANTAASVAASRRPLRLSLSSSSSPSPSLGSTALSTMANQNSAQNLSVYPSQVIGKQQTTPPSQPILSANNESFSSQTRPAKVIGHHVQHLYPQTQQLPPMQPSYSFQNLHYNVETAALNCNQISPGSGADCKNRCLPSNSNHLIHNRPMTSIGIIPPNSTYASLLRSDNYGADIMQQSQKKIDPLAKLNYSANVSNSGASYGTSSLQTRPINFSSSSSISLPSTPEHPTQPQQQQSFTYNKSPISNVVANVGAKQTTAATQLRNSQSSNIDPSTMQQQQQQQQPTTSSCIEQQLHPSSPSSSLVTESYPSNVYQQIAKSGQSIYGSIFGTSSLTHPQHRSGAISSQALPSTKVRTRFVCIGGSESELSFQPNTIITNVRTSREPGWLEGNLNGKTGLIPQNYVEFIE